MFRKYPLVFLLTLLLSVGNIYPSFADEDIENCDNPITQSQMTFCAYAQYRETDTALNERYRQLRDLLNAEQQQDLKQVQLAWIKFRDATCNFESQSWEGGSGYNMVKTLCLDAYTARRIEDINNMLEVNQR